MGWLIGLLPKRYKDLLALGEQILSRIDTPEERAEVVAHVKEMIAPNGEGGVRVTASEWMRLGAKLGLLKAKTKKNP